MGSCITRVLSFIGKEGRKGVNGAQKVDVGRTDVIDSLAYSIEAVGVG